MDKLERDDSFASLKDNQEPEKQLAINSRLAEHSALVILYARFLIFCLFLKHSRVRDDLTEVDLRKLRIKWTFLQLFPKEALLEDVFLRLTDIINPLPSDQILVEIRALCTTIATYSIGQIFTILDEGQILGRAFLDRFTKERKTRSALKPFMNAWKQVPTCVLLVSGTGLSIDVMKDSTSSGDKQNVHWAIFTDTGHFSNKETHSKYIRQHIWPDHARLSASQEAFLERAWRWLRGRFVYFNPLSSSVPDLIPGIGSPLLSSNSYGLIPRAPTGYSMRTSMLYQKDFLRVMNSHTLRMRISLILKRRSPSPGRG